jgi:hypothetical protein
LVAVCDSEREFNARVLDELLNGDDGDGDGFAAVLGEPVGARAPGLEPAMCVLNLTPMPPRAVDRAKSRCRAVGIAFAQGAVAARDARDAADGGAHVFVAGGRERGSVAPRSRGVDGRAGAGDSNSNSNSNDDDDADDDVTHPAFVDVDAALRAMSDRRVLCSHAGPHTTAFAMCTSILEDFHLPAHLISPPGRVPRRFQSRRTSTTPFNSASDAPLPNALQKPRCHRSLV